MTQILKFLNFQQLMKHILSASSCLGGAIAISQPIIYSSSKDSIITGELQVKDV